MALACTATPAPPAPTPNIDETVEARLAQERAIEATVEARLTEGKAAQPTATPTATNTPVPTATPTPIPKPTSTRIRPNWTPVPTRSPTPTPTAAPSPAGEPISLCYVTRASQLSLTGFVFQNDNETFVKVNASGEPVGYTTGVLGNYERIGAINNWHYGSISVLDDVYQWTNSVGQSWPLYPDFANGRFSTDASNPYYDSQIDSPSRYFTLLHENPVCTVNPVIVWEGLKGYLHGYASSGRSDHGYGLSYYTGIWSTFDDFQLDHYQRGHGTWITPDNSGYQQPLCPVGTVARDNWPERGPSYRDVFQTIEGGPGYWGNTRFPDRQMKYRLNSVTDCYTTQTSSPGWNWGGTSNLENQAGFAQLSNRLLYPPDGMTFRRGADGKFLGQAWMTLPLTLDHSQTSTVGTNNWTLFLNAANYSGPTVYMTPEGWSRITDGYAPAEGRGLDTLLTNSTSRALADEIGSIRSYEVRNNGQTYSRIPRMKYPVDSNQRTIFHQDVKFYSSDAIYDSITTHLQTGSALSSGRLDSQGTVDANVTSVDFGFEQNGKTIRGLENIVQTQTFGNTAWGFNWIEENSPGVFPEYFAGSDGDDYRTAISEAEVPTWTGLLDVTMPLKLTDSNRMYEPPSGGWPQPEGDQTYSVDLIDGSTVTYGWYKFIDQPSILKLNLGSAQRTRLQSLVETIHTLNWGTSNPVLAPPTFGDLVEIDDALLLTPPAGMNIGYVPVALRQHKN